MRFSLRFTTVGVPAPQGSKNPYGGEANPRTRPWRAAVTADAAQAWNGRELINGPVRLTLRFFFPRPKKHSRADGTLRADAPWHMAGAPDVDKLARAVADSLSGVVYLDDRQVAYLVARKLYGTPARVEVHVQEMR